MFAFRIDNGERMWQTPPPGCGDRRPCGQSAASDRDSGRGLLRIGGWPRSGLFHRQREDPVGLQIQRAILKPSTASAVAVEP
jgi:hypothetical protein